MNLGSKLKQGLLNLLNNEKQLFSTLRNVNNISRIRSTIKRNLKKKDRKRKHVKCQSSCMKKDENALQDIETCFEEFDTKPFEVSNPVLRTFQSAIIASDELIADLKKAISERDKEIISFLNERFVVKSLQFVTPFLNAKGSTSQITTCNKYRVAKKKKLIKWKKME